MIDLLSMSALIAIWLTPLVAIALDNRTQRNEKLAWLAATVLISWLVWVIYWLVAPISHTVPNRSNGGLAATYCAVLRASSKIPLVLAYLALAFSLALAFALNYTQEPSARNFIALAALWLLMLSALVIYSKARNAEVDLSKWGASATCLAFLIGAITLLFSTATVVLSLFAAPSVLAKNDPMPSHA